jgi:uncharacterized protein YfeS
MKVHNNDRKSETFQLIIVTHFNQGIHLCAQIKVTLFLDPKLSEIKLTDFSRNILLKKIEHAEILRT